MSRPDFLRGPEDDTSDGAMAVESSLNDALALLANHKRRAALYVLREADQDELFVVDLAQKVALLDGTTDDLETILTELTHAHLPRIAAAGVVEYDDTSSMVRYVGDDTVEQLLDHTTTLEGSD